jgi:hypothetical protein
VFERFTDRARQVVVVAQNEARALKHNYIGTEHILLGLLREEGLAARVLESFGIALEEARARVGRIVGEGDEPVTGQILFTNNAKRTLELALREALSIGHNYIGTEHILLGLLPQRRENERRATEILRDFGADAENVRDEVFRCMGGPSLRQTDEGLRVGEESKVELGLRRVVPIAQQMSGGTWVVSVEVWDHAVVLRWAASGPTASSLAHAAALSVDRGAWLVSDDAGTSYVGSGDRGTGISQQGFHYDNEFKPAPPPEAKSLLIRRESTGEEVSVSLTD